MDGFAESTKRKAAVWPLQIILLILCPEIIQDISKDVVDENNMNKVRRAELLESITFVLWYLHELRGDSALC